MIILIDATNSHPQDKLVSRKLNIALNILIKSIEEKVLGQQKLDKYDTLTICRRSKISYNIFQLLRPDKQLNSQTIYAVILISDRLQYIRFSLSVLLYEDRPKRKIRLKDPLVGQAKDIEEDRQKNANTPNFSVSLVHYRPINHRNHFSLLKVNERKRVIRHYDLNISEDIIKGTKRNWILKLAQEVFRYLQFSY